MVDGLEGERQAIEGGEDARAAKIPKHPSGAEAHIDRAGHNVRAKARTLHTMKPHTVRAKARTLQTMKREE